MDPYRAHSANVAMPRSAAAGRADVASAHYAQVWGDTVDLGHLAWSVALGIAISTGAFFAGQRVLSSFISDAAIVRAYAMLAGLAGCLLAGAICAVLFKPKRHVVEQATDETGRLRVLEQLAAESGGLGSMDDLSPSARREMSELGLLDLFAAYEASLVKTRSGMDPSHDHATAEGERG
jgi:hypothetical protein